MPRVDWSKDWGTSLFSEPRTKTVKRLIDSAIVLIDEREQDPWGFSLSRKVRLETGDYSAIVGDLDLRNVFAIERKGSPNEFLSMIGPERNRWENELRRLQKFEFRCVICEFSLSSLIAATTGRAIRQTAIWGSIVSWHVCFGIPFLFMPSREDAKGAFLKALELVIKQVRDVDGEWI